MRKYVSPSEKIHLFCYFSLLFILLLSCMGSNFSTIQGIVILQKKAIIELLTSNQGIFIQVPYSSKTPY